MKNEYCYQIEETGQPIVERSGSFIFVIFKEATYVITESLEIKSKFNERPLQFHQGLAVIDGHSTYKTWKDAIYDVRVIESFENEAIEMKVGKEEIIIVEGDKELGKIQNN